MSFFRRGYRGGIKAWQVTASLLTQNDHRDGSPARRLRLAEGLRRGE